MIQSYKIDDLMKEEVKHLNLIIEALHVKHKKYADMIQNYSHSHSVDQSEIKRIAGFSNFHVPRQHNILLTIHCLGFMLITFILSAYAGKVIWRIAWQSLKKVEENL